MKEVRGPTNKQETFIQEIMKGKSQREAYKIAYPKSRMKEASMDTEAWKLLKKPEITQRLEELRNEAKERTLWSYEMAQKELVEMLEDSKSAKNFMGRYNAIKELNNLSGFYDKKKEDKEDKAGSFFDKIGDLI